MAREDDDAPTRTTAHEIGQDLSLLSVEELGARIALLQAETARVEAAVATKKASRDAAAGFFKS